MTLRRFFSRPKSGHQTGSRLKGEFIEHDGQKVGRGGELWLRQVAPENELEETHSSAGCVLKEFKEVQCCRRAGSWEVFG